MSDLLNVHIKSLKKRLTGLISVSKINPSNPADLLKLGTLIKKLPTGSEFDNLISEIQASLDSSLTDEILQYRRGLSEFVNSAKASGIGVREGNQSWRVGSVELCLDDKQGRIQCLYNKETILPWTIARKKTDLDKILESAGKFLLDSELENRETIFQASLERQISYRIYSKEANPQRVPIRDFYREVNAELVRMKFPARGTRKLNIPNDFPLWAFLYNMDRQFSSPKEDGSQPFYLDTGSQAETSKGMAVCLNGLDASRDYKQYCFIKPTR